MKSTQITTEAELQRLMEVQVRQSNAITSGKMDYSACQLDVLFMLLSALDTHNDEYLIHCKDIELITGRKWNYTQYREGTKEMLGRVYEIEDSETLTQMVLFQYFKYQKGKGSIKIKIASEAKPLFFDLKKNFTVLQLKSVLSLTSKYAKRIYGLCCQWRSMGFKEYDLKAFKEILGLIDEKTGVEQFKSAYLFKEKVLNIAKEQINRCTNIRFDYKLEKKFHSRSLNSITIYINNPTPEQLRLELEQSDVDFNLTIEHQRNIKNIMAYGLSEKQANQILKNGTYKDFETVIDEVKKAVVKKKVTNQIGYLCGILQNKKLLD